MLSRKDLNLDELEFECPDHLGSAKHMRKQQKTSTTGTSSWRYKSSRTRLQSCRWANSAKITDIPMSGPVDKNSKGQKCPMQHRKLCATRCPRTINRFFQFECKCISCIVTAGHVWWFFVKSNNYTTSKCKHSSIWKPTETPKRQFKKGYRHRHGETGCEICQSGWRNSRKISKTKWC